MEALGTESLLELAEYESSGCEDLFNMLQYIPYKNGICSLKFRQGTEGNDVHI